MALSQLQCLDDNHVNPRTHESKPEFFYCEDQRLALEALLRDGREGFTKFLEARGLRGFLSDPELETLTGRIEPYDPGSELYAENAGDEPVPLSLHYWPDESDVSIPQMDLGWPDSEAYRGVTRTTVYTQPPMDGQAHIKEVVRKIIVQAQKVIAVVMDIFTDVDIFRDLMDAGFKRKVSIYILLERTNLPHFLSMCQRANMHRGHLKQLRVRCTEGAEFYTRSCTKVRGQLGHRFMFVDGDKAVSGSYSFTWMSSRLDRNLITVTTGQAVNSFDQLFRFLFANSRHVDLRQVTKDSEPEPEPLPQKTTVAPPSADVARKLYNPKYALVMATNPSPTVSDGPECPKEPETSEDPKMKKRKKVVEEAPPPLHPGLVNLEKACLISYLPIWPEPDPPSDVIGFINIRDARRPTQVHLQRSEMFETSQAIRFSSPFAKTEEPLPKEVKPRNLSYAAQEINRFQPTQTKTTGNDALAEKPQPGHLGVTKGVVSSKENTPERTPILAQPERFDNKPVNTGISQNPGSKVTNPNPDTCPQSSNKKLIPSQATSPFATQNLAMNSSSSDFIQKLNSLNTESNTVYKSHPLNSHSSQTLQLPSKQDTQGKTPLFHTDLHKKVASVQAKAISPTSSVEDPLSPNNHTFTTAHSSSTATATVSTISPSPLNPTRKSPPFPSFRNSSPNLHPPVPKPRTVQLLIKDGSNSNAPIHIVRKPNAKSDPEAKSTETHREPATPPASQSIPDNSSEPQESGNKEAQRQNESVKSQETKGEDVVQRDAKMNAVTEKALQTSSYTSFKLTPKTDGKRETTKIKETKAKTPISTDSKIVPKTEDKASVESSTKSSFRMSNNLPDVSDPVVPTLKPGTLPDVPPAKKQLTNKVSDAVTKLTCGTDIVFKDRTVGPTKSHTHTVLPEESDKVEGNTHTLEKSTLPSPYAWEWRSPTSEREPITSTKQTPTPDKFPTCSPTPDSGTPTLDPRSFTPDFRTPTPDISDGYVSSREDSNLSTTSDEYYECSESPNNEPVFNFRLYHTPNLAEDHTNFTHTATNFSATGTSPTNMNYNSGASDWNTLISDSQALTGPSRDRSSSLLEKKAKTNRTNDAGKEEKEKVEDKKDWKPDMAQRVAGDSPEIERKGNEVTKQDRSLTETGDHTKELPASRKQRALNKSTASPLIGEGVTAGQPTMEGTESNRLSGGGLKPETVYQREKASKVTPGKEKVSIPVAQKASGAERKDKQLSNREAGEQKHGSGTSPPARPLRSPRSISISQYLGARPWGGRQLNQTESKVLEVLDGPVSHHKSQVRPSPTAQGPAVAAAGQRQSQQGPSRQPPTAQSRTRTGATSNQTSLAKLPASSAQTNASMNPPVQSPSQSQGLGQDDGKIAFNFTLSKLYNLKGLKEKLSKGPQQNKRSSPSSPGEGQKNSS